MSIILRNTKGSPLTYSELDGNFTYLSESYAIINGENTFTGNQSVVGNLTVYGTASFSSVTSSASEISSSTFGVTISTPAIPRGIYDVYDTGLTNNTASLIWDSASDRWVYRKVAGSTTSAILLTGPKGTSGLGNESTLTQYRIPVSNGDQSLIDSNISTNGSDVAITGSLTSRNSIAISDTIINSSPSYGKFLAISGSYPGLILGHSNVGKAYSFGVGDFSQFFIYDDTSNAFRVVIESNGFIGLGKSPSTFLDVSGSTAIGGRLNVSQGITGSLLGTASFATQALNASTASLSTTASFALTSSLATTASFALTASFAANVPATASYALQALNASTSSIATTASYVLNAVSSSFASTSSFINPLRQTVNITGSVRINNTGSASTAFVVTGRSGSIVLDINGTGGNYIDGNNLFIRNSAGTITTALFTTASTSINNTTNISGTLNVNGSTNITSPTTLSSSLYVRRVDGNVLVNITSSISSSTSASVVDVSASFDGVISFLPGGATATTWNTDLEIYYSGVSGSGHTELSPVSIQTSDGQQYNNFNITLNNGIVLDYGSIPDDKYTLWIYASGSINKWFSRGNNDITTLKGGGYNITLSGGDTNSSLEGDLVGPAGFSEMPGFDPNAYTNDLTYNLNTISNVTSSIFQVNANSSFTGSLSVSGSGRYIGDQTITGSIRLNSDGNGTGLFINGQKQFNYISLYHTASITPTQNISGSFIYSNTALSSGISLVSGSRITFANTGIYNIQFSAQLYTPTNNTIVDIWFKKNGTNIANSATKIDFGNSDYGVAAWNFVDTFESGSYVEIAYQTDKTDTQFQYATATGNIPAIPSIIATVTQVA